MLISSNVILTSAGKKGDLKEERKCERKAECMHMLSSKNKYYLEVWGFFWRDLIY